MKQKLSIFMWVVFFAAVLTWLSLAEYTAELRNAYDWAFTNKITTQTSIDTARLDSEITRQALSKMMVVYSKDILMKEPDYSLKCNFTDKEEITEDLKWYAIEACQLWIMWEWNNAFDPMWKVTVAQFWTILSRALWWNMYDWSDPYYLSHLYALEENKILDDISDPEERNISRWEVITALMRSTNWVGHSSLLFSEDLDEYYETYDPEIEYLMTENNLSEKEKEVIREHINKLNEWLILEIYDVFEFLEKWDEENYKANINKADEKIESIKEGFKKYLSDYKTIYETLNVNLSDTTQCTPWEMILKIEEFNTAIFKVLDTTKDMISFAKNICDEYNCDLESNKEVIEEKYWDKIKELWEKYEKIKTEFNKAEDKYYEYLEEYKMANKYWRAYEDSLINPEDVDYQPKDAVNISWYLVWEDLTRYQGDIKDQKMEGHWIITYWDYYYSWEWKNNVRNWFWEFQWKGFRYVWNFRNWKPDWFWVYTSKNETYTWEWLWWKRHWTWEISTEEFYFSWLWKFDEPSKWKIIYTNWTNYEWEFEHNLFEGQGKLTLTSNDVYEWNFNYWEIDWYGELTTANWEVYSWKWEEGFLSGQDVLIKDWKVMIASKIDVIENQWNDTIVITDWVDTLTIMNKNIWASEVWTWETSYGSYFKWWNNTAFNSLDTWDSKDFIKAGTWVWEEKDQGPCPKWYHIPSTNEWNWLISLWRLKNNISYFSSGDVKNFMDTFKLPYAWYRYWFTAINWLDLLSWSIDDIKETEYDGFALRYSDRNIYYGGRYWSSTLSYRIDSDSPEYMYYWFHIMDYNAENDNSYEFTSNSSIEEVAYPIRCFKD